MKSLFRSRWTTLGFGTLLIVALWFWIPTLKRVSWVGHTDLEIEFIIFDAVSGEPIPGAVIQIKSEGGFCAEREKMEFSLTADANGSAKRLLKDCMSFGTSGAYIDTYCVHLPWWIYRVEAVGYTSSGWTALDTPENARKVQRGNPAAQVAIRTELRR